MVVPALPFLAALYINMTECSPTRATSSSINNCNTEIASLSWRIADFEWRTGYVDWSYYIGVGPAPPPPPTQWYTCGEAMIRMNITRVSGNENLQPEPVVLQEQAIPCVEQTNDAKLANITNMADYNAGPSGPPPPSPHWFTCDMDHQLFIFPDGTTDEWGNNDVLANLTTKIRMDPVKMTLDVAQSWPCVDDGSESEVHVMGSARLPTLSCRERTNLEDDANFLINSPVMHGYGYGAKILNGTVCTGTEFIISINIEA